MDNDRNTAASRIKRLTPEERADMADVLDAGTSLYDRDVRALIDHATAMDDEVTALRAERDELRAALRRIDDHVGLDAGKPGTLGLIGEIAREALGDA